ncbi:MAG: restriction endonuclease subunit S [Paratractidigestivibacter faecalis]|uniref:restriction endonuclease subunit S n=1 Tax=Paratractidigestivibacter faecalis TaxID=2292441 RepID=UPI0026EECA94|nr:restriction endonuclease subunit S [Paratractidigestivibacter faecalis]MDD6417284.1 restriction endonuclease subunit S [Paratractidigestivibacter faecalis]
MECRKKVRLSDVAELTPGFAFKSTDFGEYSHKAIKITNISREGYSDTFPGVDIDAYPAGKLDKYLIGEGDYYLAMTGSIGKVGRLVRGSAYLNQRVLGLKAKSQIDADYLWFVLNSADFYRHLLTHIDSHSVQANISAESVGSFEFDLPPMNVQLRIGFVLGSFDKKIIANNRINGYLEELALAMLREEVVGSFPYGVTTVGAFAKQMSNGATPSRKQPHYWNGGTIPWVKTGEVNNNIIFRTEEHITQEALEKTSVHLLPVDTVVMALYGRGTAGRVGLLKTRATTNQACTAMICSSSSRAFYLYLILQNMFKQIDSLTRGSVQQNLSKDIVADIQIPDITNDYLNDRGFGLIYSKIAEGERENLTLGELRDALLPKLMSGEIDVSNVMVPMKEGKS